MTTSAESIAELTADEIKDMVSKQLRAARLLRGYSLRQAARFLEISPSYLSQIETGKRNLSLDLLFSAARRYRVSVDVLLGREALPGSGGGRKFFEIFAPFFRLGSTGG